MLLNVQSSQGCFSDSPNATVQFEVPCMLLGQHSQVAKVNTLPRVHSFTLVVVAIHATQVISLHFLHLPTVTNIPSDIRLHQSNKRHHSDLKWKRDNTSQSDKFGIS